jgi:cyclic pyranopterin phosphate synthase
VSAAQIIEAIDTHLPLEPVGPNYPGEVAERWRYRDGSGEIGVVASVTQAFCDTCTRARLSIEGRLYLCLFASRGYDLRSILRGGADDLQLAAAIAGVWSGRTDQYSMLRGKAQTAAGDKVEMSYIGG